MGRPIKKSWFGNGPGSELLMRAKWADGTIHMSAKVMKQVSSAGYILTNLGNKAEVCRLQNTVVAADLLPGRCFTTATPFGGTELPVSKITQYKVSVWNPDGSQSTYTWGSNPAALPSEATLLMS